MHRSVPWFAAAVLVVVMAAPALTDPPTDGFPLSTYPMFAVDRGDRVSISTAVGHTASGDRVRLSPTILAGADEPILAVRTARHAVDSGNVVPWCDEVALRAARVDRDDPLVRIEVVTETHHARRTVTESADPLEIESHATCAVALP